MEGWIKLHRSLINHWIIKDSDKFKAWITILLTVNHNSNKVNIGNYLIECGRGESLKSLDSWVKIFGKGWNKSKVRRFLTLLENDSMIELIPNTKTTHLRVCKYDSYQSERNANETEVKRKRNGSETVLTPNKNDKKEKNDKEYSDEIKHFTHSILKHFPIQPKKIESWYDITDKLINLDNYNFDSIKLIIETFTADGNFWKPNFQSYTKLRNLNKDKIKYVDYFKNTLIAEKNGANKGNNSKKQGTTIEELQQILSDEFD